MIFSSYKVSDTFFFQTEFGTLISVTTCLRMWIPDEVGLFSYLSCKTLSPERMTAVLGS